MSGSSLKPTSKRTNPSLSDIVNDGWTRYGSSAVAVYVSGTSFKISGVDRTADFTTGRKLRIYHATSAAYKYVRVTSSSFSTDTTVNVAGDTLLNEVYSSIWIALSSPVGYSQDQIAGATPTAGDFEYVDANGRFARLAKPTVPGVLLNDATGIPQWITTGWIPMGVTLTYSSVDDPTGVVTSSVDLSTILSVGNRLRFINGGNTIYGIITAISGTTITFLHEIDPTDSLALTLMANSAITVPYFSYHKVPYGFPVDPRKWTILVTDITDRTQGTPAASTWYNVGTTNSQITIPIGAWDVSYQLTAFSTGNSGEWGIFTTLSTTNNSATNVNLTTRFGGPTGVTRYTTVHCSDRLILSSKTLYYLNMKMDGVSPTDVRFNNSSGGMYMRAVSTYL